MRSHHCFCPRLYTCCNNDNPNNFIVCHLKTPDLHPPCEDSMRDNLRKSVVKTWNVGKLGFLLYDFQYLKKKLNLSFLNVHLLGHFKKCYNNHIHPMSLT